MHTSELLYWSTLVTASRVSWSYWLEILVTHQVSRTIRHKFSWLALVMLL